MGRRPLFTETIDDLIACAKAIERICDLHLRRKKLTTGAFAVMRALEECEAFAATSSELLQLLPITQSTLSCHLRVLQDRKLIRHIAGPPSKAKDKRVKTMQLSPEGFGLLREISDTYWFPHVRWDAQFSKDLATVRDSLESELIDMQRRRAPILRARKEPESRRVETTGELF